MSPIITKKDTYYTFNPDGKFSESILQCDTVEEFNHALESLKATGSLPESTNISNIMSIIKAQGDKLGEWKIKLDKKMEKALIRR